jgi:hypothetical protein
MQLLYNSESFAVVQFDAPTLTEPGLEIVDKVARREIYIQGALAERFLEGVKSLAESGPSEDQFDDFIAGFATSAQQSVVLH